MAIRYWHAILIIMSEDRGAWEYDLSDVVEARFYELTRESWPAWRIYEYACGYGM